MITDSTFEFLELVKQNNYREWFNAHKNRYLKEFEIVINFADALLAEMNHHDVIETASGKKSLHRIYKDTRFSKDKTPYKSHWGGSFKRATKHRRGGYYFHIEKGNSFVGGGFWNPNPEDLKRMREEIALDGDGFRKIINSPAFKKTFGHLQGEKLKTAPKGFDADHPEIDLLRYKQFLLMCPFTDEEVLSEDFVKKASETFKKMRPFLDFMTQALTTDSNGIAIF